MTAYPTFRTAPEMGNGNDWAFVMSIPKNVRHRWREALTLKRDYAKRPHRDRPPIIVLGFNKTGTTTLHRWFEANGIRSLHHGGYHRKNNVAARIARNIENRTLALRGMEHFEAFSDLSYTDNKTTIDGNRYYIELFESYPDAYFILNHRPVDEWLLSRQRHSNGTLMERSKRIHGLTTDEILDLWRDVYASRLRDIRSFFSDKVAHFLDIEMNNETAAKITAFLKPHYDLSPNLMRRHNQNTILHSSSTLAHADALTGEHQDG
mmetsp:Transcript_1004/g.1941  ORF Transcript_1004/g.1941 Transcript_1004/m.1941 type:complete len:264 (-) Transcript_1004:259-1050(-)